MKSETARRIPSTKWLAASVVTLALASGLSFWLGRRHSPESGEPVVAPAEQATTYYCTMHPHIRLPHPGKCSICGMDLIPLRESSGAGPRAIEISEVAMKLAEIETVKVERRRVSTEVRMVGKIDFDETRMRTITARVSGRLDRLYVDYAGIPIREGDHLADIYSPKLYAAQQELIEALRAVGRLKESTSTLARGSTEGTLKAVREKLRLLGLGPSQIREIEARGSPSDHVLIRATIGGVVVSKLANEGDYVETGDPIYRIADLSSAWVKLDAYESDLAWLRYGQDVEFSTEAYPGEIFRGKIRFIGWEVTATRTVKVRVNVDNPQLRLKPGMFVRAAVDAALGSGGLVMSPELKGKWISPMHPEIVKDGPGTCDVCGMDLVPAAEIFTSEAGSDEPPLVIPVGAALLTGRRAVVYVRLPGREKPTFEGKEVVLGPRAGDHYVVLSGLEEGEEVVARGNFKIDSALQIEAKPSMMNPTGGASGAAHFHAHDAPAGPAPSVAPAAAVKALRTPQEFQAAMTRLRNGYFELVAALAADEFERAKEACAGFGEALAAVPIDGLGDDALATWKDLASTAGKEVELASRTERIGSVRESLRKLSRMMLDAEQRFGHSDGTVFYEAFCPMAFDGEGDSWLQSEKTIANPYFGAAMLRCGEIRNEFVTRSSEPEPGAEQPANGAGDDEEGHDHD